MHDQVEERREGETQGGTGVRLPLRLHTLGTKSSLLPRPSCRGMLCPYTPSSSVCVLLVIQCCVYVHSIRPCVLPNNPVTNTAHGKPDENYERIRSKTRRESPSVPAPPRSVRKVRRRLQTLIVCSQTHTLYIRMYVTDLRSLLPPSMPSKAKSPTPTWSKDTFQSAAPRYFLEAERDAANWTHLQ